MGRAARHERAPDVMQRKSRQAEKHRAKPGEDVIVRTTKIIALRIGDKERSVLDRYFRGLTGGEVDEILRAIDTHGFSPWAYLCRNAPGRLAKTATDIQLP